MRPNRIVFVRHGETAWNLERRFLGHSNLGLNEKGTFQARAAADLLRQENIEHIFCSDLVRAMETGLEIARWHDLPVHKIPSLRELYFGEWEGLTFSEIESRYPDLSSAWLNDPTGVNVPAGETAEEFRIRVMETWDDITEVSGEKTIVIVAHGGPLRMILCHLTKIDLSRQWEYNIDHGEVVVMDKIGDEYTLIYRSGGNLGPIPFRNGDEG